MEATEHRRQRRATNRDYLGRHDCRPHPQVLPQVRIQVRDEHLTTSCSCKDVSIIYGIWENGIGYRWHNLSRIAFLEKVRFIGQGIISANAIRFLGADQVSSPIHTIEHSVFGQTTASASWCYRFLLPSLQLLLFSVLKKLSVNLKQKKRERNIGPEDVISLPHA